MLWHCRLSRLDQPESADWLFDTMGIVRRAEKIASTRAPIFWSLSFADGEGTIIRMSVDNDRAGLTITPDGLMKMAISDANPSRARIKMIETVRDHVSNFDAQNDGVVVAVRAQNQRKEVPALIDEMGLTHEQYSVRVSGRGSDDLNSLGRQDHTNAIVLFVTQSQPDDAVLWDPWDKQLDEDPYLMFRGKLRYVRLSKELGLRMDLIPAKEFLEAHRTDPSLQKVTPERLLQVAREF
jgi:hypothetical protein